MPEINRKIQTDQESIKSKKEENKIKLEPVMNKFLPSLIIFSIPQRNKYNSMQIVIEQPLPSRQHINKRFSSTNFHSKKIKSLLSSRETFDNITQNQNQQHETQNDPGPNPPKPRKNKTKKIELQTGQLKVRNSFHQLLAEIIKPMKYQKTQAQTLLLKNCDKTKLIFWSKDLALLGNEKYLIVSADLILDQDSFWDKLPSDNGNFPTPALQSSNTLATLNHNSTLTYRNRNNFVSHSKTLSGSTHTIPNAFQKGKNPLISSNKLTSLIKEWKNLHCRYDCQGRRVIVLWLIRKQSAYSYLLEFSQANQLPLHGIFYAKRKRANPFIDIGPLVKEIHQRFLQSVINPQVVQPQARPEQRKSMDLSREMKKGRSKQLTSKQLHQTVSGCSLMKKTLESLTSRVAKSKMDSKRLQNDENSSSALNSQTCKEFELSKNAKRSLGSIVVDEKRVRSILKKTGPLSSNRQLKKGSMRINEMIEATGKDFRSKYDVSPLMDEVKEGCSERGINEFEVRETVREPRFVKPEIYLLQGVKCNSKGYCSGETYHGKVPILFDCYKERLQQVINKLRQQQVDIQLGENGSEVKTYYLKYEAVKENGLESINNLTRELVNRRPHNEYTYEQYKVSSFMHQKLIEILKQLGRNSNPSTPCSSKHNPIPEPQLTEQQQDSLIQKTQTKLQQLKKQTIDHFIALKGRHYTFQNGQSIYYFVGDAFKRNYNLLYDQYYQLFERELLTALMAKNKHKEKNQTGNKTYDTSTNTDSTFSSDHQTGTAQIATLQLSEIQFFQTLSY